MRLTLALGGMTFSELLDRMPAWEPSYWAAFQRLEGPVGPGRDDALAGLVSATVLNAAPFFPKKKGDKRELASADDLTPVWDAQERELRRRSKKERLARQWVGAARKMKIEQETDAHFKALEEKAGAAGTAPGGG